MKEEVVEKPVAAVYDPTKQYSWSEGNMFIFSGSEFGLILNALRTTLGTKEAQAILLADRANNIVESVLAKAVERGDVKEKTQ